MKNENYKLRKKELKNSIIEVVSKTLKLNEEDNSTKKLKKMIRKAAGSISKKYLKTMKKVSKAEQKSVKSIKPTKKTSGKIKGEEVIL